MLTPYLWKRILLRQKLLKSFGYNFTVNEREVWVRKLDALYRLDFIRTINLVLSQFVISFAM